MSTLPKSAIEALTKEARRQAVANDGNCDPTEVDFTWMEGYFDLEGLILVALPHLGGPIGYISKTQADGLLKGYQGVWTVSNEQNAVYSEAVYLAPPAPAVAVPAGWKLVPIEPMPEMIAAFWRQKNTGTQEIGERGNLASDYDAYRAMLAAAPVPPPVSISEIPNSSPPALFEVTKEWLEKRTAQEKAWFEMRAAQEGDLDVRAGKRVTSTINLTTDEIAELERLLPRRPADPLMEQMAEALRTIWENFDGSFPLYRGNMDTLVKAVTALAAYEAERAAT